MIIRAARTGTSITWLWRRRAFMQSRPRPGANAARRNALDLSRELTSAISEPVVVKPILTFPGWYVNRTGKSDVTVLNPKEIRKVVLSTAGAQLSPEQIQRVAHQVEQKCRDVVF